MHAKPFVIGTLAGAAAIFVTGTLLFSLPTLAAFYIYSMTSGAATGVPRDAPIVWAALLGSLSYAALVTLAILKQSGPVAVMAGIRAGAAVGFLLWLSADLMLYAVSNVGNVTTTLIDPLLELVPGAIAGGVIAGLLKRSHLLVGAHVPREV